MPPNTWSALSVTRVSMSTACSFAIEDNASASAPDSQVRAACSTSWRAASTSVAFSASANEIA